MQRNRLTSINAFTSRLFSEPCFFWFYDFRPKRVCAALYRTNSINPAASIFVQEYTITIFAHWQNQIAIWMPDQISAIKPGFSQPQKRPYLFGFLQGNKDVRIFAGTTMTALCAFKTNRTFLKKEFRNTGFNCIHWMIVNDPGIYWAYLSMTKIVKSMENRRKCE